MISTILDQLMRRCTMLELQGKSHKPNEADARLVVHAAASLPVISVYAEVHSWPVDVIGYARLVELLTEHGPSLRLPH